MYIIDTFFFSGSSSCSNLIKQFQLCRDGVEIHIIHLHLLIYSTIPCVFHHKLIPLRLRLKELSMLPDDMQPIIFLEIRVVNHFVDELYLHIDAIISTFLSQLVQVAHCVIMELGRLRRYILLLLHRVLLPSPVDEVLFSLGFFFLLL